MEYRKEKEKIILLKGLIQEKIIKIKIQSNLIIINLFNNNNNIINKNFLNSNNYYNHFKKKNNNKASVINLVLIRNK